MSTNPLTYQIKCSARRDLSRSFFRFAAGTALAALAYLGTGSAPLYVGIFSLTLLFAGLPAARSALHWVAPKRQMSKMVLAPETVARLLSIDQLEGDAG